MSPQITSSLVKPDEEMVASFLKLHSKADLAELLEVPLNRLLWHLHKADKTTQYRTIHIPKRTGEYRVLVIPVSAIKILQSKLNHVLQLVYKDYQKAGVHGFVKGKSIISNAASHSDSNLVFNIDLLNFFPSISFGRVMRTFQKRPYSLPEDVATAIAQLCCFEGKLPQGAPTSPIVSNFVCARLDVELKRMAAQGGCTYSRYADDITFSTRHKKFPDTIVNLEHGRYFPGSALLNIIRQSGFKVNEGKTRYLAENQRKLVTGLVVHKKRSVNGAKTPQRINVPRTYYRELRTLLFFWKKAGYEQATQKLLDNYSRYRAPNSAPPKLEHVVRGKIDFLGQVRGRDDTIYLNYISVFNRLYQRDCV